MEFYPYSRREIDIKRFKKVKRIKKGGFGVVYSVQEIETNKMYAAKVIDCDDDEEQSQKMIDREIGILMLIYHTTIIKLYGYSLRDFQNEFNVTLIMYLAQNGSLADILQKIKKANGPADFTNTSRKSSLLE